MANEDDISASNGDADVPQKNDIESNFAEPFDHEDIRSSNSVVARLRERASQTKELKRAMQQWCQEPNPVIEDLDRLAPYLFGVKCNETGSCTICNAVTCLKACCDHFLECKTEHDASEKAYAAAVELHEQLIKRRSSKKGRALKALNGRLSLQAQNLYRQGCVAFERCKEYFVNERSRCRQLHDGYECDRSCCRQAQSCPVPFESIEGCWQCKFTRNDDRKSDGQPCELP